MKRFVVAQIAGIELEATSEESLAEINTVTKESTDAMAMTENLQKDCVAHLCLSPRNIPTLLG